MRFLIVLEPTEEGFAVQVPDLAIITYGTSIEAAKDAAREAVLSNLETYRELGQAVPPSVPVDQHFANPDFDDVLFSFVDVLINGERIAA